LCLCGVCRLTATPRKLRGDEEASSARLSGANLAVSVSLGRSAGDEHGCLSSSFGA
jgi:hypothetical protein